MKKSKKTLRQEANDRKRKQRQRIKTWLKRHGYNSPEAYITAQIKKETNS